MKKMDSIQASPKDILVIEKAQEQEVEEGLHQAHQGTKHLGKRSPIIDSMPESED